MGDLKRLICLLAVLYFTAIAEAEEDRSSLIRSIAKQHSIATRSGTKLSMRTDPVLVWSNPVRGDTSGGIFLWREGERPVAFGGIYIWVQDRQTFLSREFHSLTTRSLVGSHKGQVLWTPTTSNLKFKELDGADPPAASTFLRLRQLKRIAAEFKIEISQRDRPTDTLRALPTPIYRYQDEKSKIIDGAIIAFCQGNDPEVMLLIEAIKGEDGKSVWRYAFARCTSWSIESKRKGTVAYKAETYGWGRTPPTSPFLIITKQPLERTAQVTQ